MLMFASFTNKVSGDYLMVVVVICWVPFCWLGSATVCDDSSSRWLLLEVGLVFQGGCSFPGRVRDKVSSAVHC